MERTRVERIKLTTRLWETQWNDGSGELEFSMLGMVTNFVLVIMVFFAIIAAILIPISVAECHQGAERVGTTGSYRFPSGCYYRTGNGNEIPAGEYVPKSIRIEPHPGGYRGMQVEAP